MLPLLDYSDIQSAPASASSARNNAYINLDEPILEMMKSPLPVPFLKPVPKKQMKRNFVSNYVETTTLKNAETKQHETTCYTPIDMRASLRLEQNWRVYVIHHGFKKMPISLSIFFK